MSTTRVNQDWVSGFTGDTPILMANGTFKPISEIKPGDEVASFDSRTGDSTIATVSEVFCDIYDDSLEITVDDNTMIVAASQLFYTSDMEFKSAVEAGTIVTVDGIKTLRFKRYKGGKVRFYDISVDDTDVFIADGLLVHNKKKGSNTKQTSKTPGNKKNSGKKNDQKKGNKNKNKDKNKDKVKVDVDIDIDIDIDLGSESDEDTATIDIDTTVQFEGDGDLIIDIGWADDPSGVAGDSGLTASYDEEAAGYRPPTVIKNPVPTKVVNELESAQNKRNTVCKALGKIKKKPSKAQIKNYSEDLQAVIKDVNQANKSDSNKSRDDDYKAINKEIKELKNYINSQKKFEKKQKKFIDQKCNVIQKNIKKTLNNIANTGNGTIIINRPIFPIKPRPPVSPGNPESDVNRIYSSDPKYDYFAQLPNRDNTGCTSYVQDEPGESRPYIGNVANNSGYTNGYTKSDLWYKHFDTNKGKFYYSKSSQNCL